jgi:hypothetical protein
MSKEQKLDTKEVKPYTPLPTDVLCNVTSFIDFDDRSRLLQSASCFKVLVGKKQSYPPTLNTLDNLYHPVCTIPNDDGDKKQELKAFRAQLAIFGPVITTLAINCNRESDENVDTRFIEKAIYGPNYSAREFFQSFPNLTSLTLRRMSSWDMMALQPDWKLVHLSLDLHSNFTGRLNISSEEVEVDNDYNEEEEEEHDGGPEYEDLVSIGDKSFKEAKKPHEDALQALTTTVGENYPDLESFEFTFELLGLFKEYMDNDTNGNEDEYFRELDCEFDYDGMFDAKKKLRKLTMKSFILPYQRIQFEASELKETLPCLETLTTTDNSMFINQISPTVTNLTIYSGSGSYPELQAFPNLKRLTVEGPENIPTCHFFHGLQIATSVQLTLNNCMVTHREPQCLHCLESHVTYLRLDIPYPIYLRQYEVTLATFPVLHTLSISNLNQTGLQETNFWEVLRPGFPNILKIQADNLSAGKNELLNEDLHQFDKLGKEKKAWLDKIKSHFS